MNRKRLAGRSIALYIIAIAVSLTLAYLVTGSRTPSPVVMITPVAPTSTLTPRPTSSLLPPATAIPVAVTLASTPTARVNQWTVLSATRGITKTGGIPVYTYKIVNTYPHDRAAFTQGLIFVDGVLYEGTGLYGQSSLRRVKLETGEVLQVYALPARFFGEGLTLFGDKLIQLTWKERVGFVYNKDTFKQERDFAYPTEGWGFTHDGARLIMSDGSANLYFIDPATLTEISRIQVVDDQGPVVRLNELEYINGEVYANIWQTDRIARIDPATGRVLAWLDMSGLLSDADRRQHVDVLNGIAYDAAHDRLFVTGKLWPKLFEIELIPK